MEIRVLKFTYSAYNLVFKWQGGITGASAVSRVKYLKIGDKTYNISSLRKINYASAGYNGIWVGKSQELYDFLNQNGHTLQHNVEIDVNNMFLLDTLLNAEPEPTIEWKPMSRTEIIRRGTSEVEAPHLLPLETYVENGSDGEVRIDWEEKFVDGKSTGEKRNEKRTTIKSPVNDKRYIGTKKEEMEITLDSIINFKGVNMIFYNNEQMQFVYYMGEKIWEGSKEVVLHDGVVGKSELWLIPYEDLDKYSKFIVAENGYPYAFELLPAQMVYVEKTTDGFAYYTFKISGSHVVMTVQGKHNGQSTDITRNADIKIIGILK